MSCFSCHTMHKTADDPRSIGEWADTHQVSAGMDGNEACLQCHPALRANLDRAHEAPSRIDGSSCYNCHMPYTTYGLLRALRSHQISSPTVAASVEHRPAERLQPVSSRQDAGVDGRVPRERGTGRHRSRSTPDERDDCRVDALAAARRRRPAGADGVEHGLAAGAAGVRHRTGWRASLSMLLNDPYDAVRFIAYRSLRVAARVRRSSNTISSRRVPRRIADTMRALETSRRLPGPAPARDPALLLDGSGAPRMDAIVRLGLQRNDRPVVLRE